MGMHEEFVDSVEEKTLSVGVVGLGYVGLPLILCFAEKGFRTVGLDIDSVKTKTLMRGESYIKHIPAERISQAVKSGLFLATDDFRHAAQCDAILIAVPTP
ncbi:MAG TPA: NAD(P)-binding domain-containing protein, partial [Bacteroidota bacterium]|nr:NAD(P)-binding domain-containing protein [Bacteroidota bacterium]